MKYHPVVHKITNLLEENSCWYKTFEHESVRTSEEAEKTRPGYSLSQGAKALIVRVKISNANKKFMMLVLPGDVRFDSKKVKKLFGAKDVRFASKKEVAELTDGVEPGGVPPFGNLFSIEVIADPTLLENEKIVFNAGDRRFSVAMLADDYRSIVEPEVADIV